MRSETQTPIGSYQPTTIRPNDNPTKAPGTSTGAFLLRRLGDHFQANQPVLASHIHQPVR